MLAESRCAAPIRRCSASPSSRSDCAPGRRTTCRATGRAGCAERTAPAGSRCGRCDRWASCGACSASPAALHAHHRSDHLQVARVRPWDRQHVRRSLASHPARGRPDSSDVVWTAAVLRTGLSPPRRSGVRADGHRGCRAATHSPRPSATCALRVGSGAGEGGAAASTPPQRRRRAAHAACAARTWSCPAACTPTA